MSNKRGRVISRTKGFYYLLTEQGEKVECKVKGQLFKDSQFDNQIAVGDIVRFSKPAAEKVGLISGIEERTSFLSRSRVGKEAEQIIAANIDYLLIVVSTQQPSFRANLVNRMLVAAKVGNIIPVLVITKTDLSPDSNIEALLRPYKNLGLKIILSSIFQNGISDELKRLLSNHVCLLAGQSGVGKSSLLNLYFPGLSLRVKNVSEKTSKGAHTTTYARMYQIAENGFVIDTPGIREFGLWNLTRANLDEFYPSFDSFIDLCKHRDCAHIHEPGCAVKQAVQAGYIHPGLYAGYIAIYDSLPA